MGYPKAAAALAVNLMRGPFKKQAGDWQRAMLRNVLEKPASFLADPNWRPLVEKLGASTKAALAFECPELRKSPAPHQVFGGEAEIAENAKQQLYDALRLPVAVAGALMPDAHHGYGLPIGGVLATENAVIPYGVGVDIGCRMCLTVYDLPGKVLAEHRGQWQKLLRDNTAFGDQSLDRPYDDPILEHETFRLLPEAKRLRDKAAKQIGSSGGGNHFVEFGEVALPAGNQWQLPAGTYLGVLSHSGSRGMGASLAMHFTKLAMQLTRLPKAQRNLAWLRMDSDAGRAYWAAMNLAGDYATACHDHIHRRMAKSLALRPLFKVENHHNFAWEERLADGRQVIVHRKGATPAKQGELGIIPGSMTAPGYIVAGRGFAGSLQSASHGAGRQLSRTVAKNSITRHALEKELEAQQVTLIGGGLDEAPFAYKDIRKVMRDQTDLVDVLGVFRPRVVRMA